jgi:hypothetical protein
VKLRACSAQPIPLLSRSRVQPISRQRKSDPRPAVDENRLPCRIGSS